MARQGGRTATHGSTGLEPGLEGNLRVLVTGGAGYIGSHACKALAQAGHSPIAYDNLRTGHRWAVKWGPFEHGDITDGARLNEVMRRTRQTR